MNVVNAKQRASVRWPFRLLALLIVLACALAVVGNLIAGWQFGWPALKWQFMAALPGSAWLARLAWHAAIRGRPPASAHWPFASEKVLGWYVMLLTFMMLT